MGVSAILILVHHYFTNILDKAYRFGAIGVDIFMFVMGFGLFFSLYNGVQKKPFIKTLPSFFFRRIKKIFPAFAAFLIFWGMWKFSNGGFTLKAFLLNLSFTGYWTLNYGEYFNWFISGILLFYLLAPLFFIAIYKTKYKFSAGFILFAVISVLTFLMRKDENGEITRTLIMVVRLIPFCFGMLFGAYCKEEPQKSKQTNVLLFFGILFVVGVILYVQNNKVWNDNGFTYGMPWYSFGLMTPFSCVTIAYIAEFISKLIPLVNHIFSFFGKMSFEIYLTHIFVIEYVLYYLHKKNNLWFSEPMNFIAAFFVSTISAYILHCFAEKISSFTIKKQNLK
jgi:peptidoglycan/LPS O-acetylase OafA/YrhL